MLGKQKFKKDEKVTFDIEGEKYHGKIWIIDAWGVFEDNTDVHYDIIGYADKYKTKDNPKGECIFKHVKETFVERDNN